MNAEAEFEVASSSRRSIAWRDARGSPRTAQLREKPLPQWLICFADTN
jgi:hypothetical protein